MERILKSRYHLQFFFFWFIVVIQSSTGKTTCGWLFRGNLLTAQLSRFTSTFRLNVLPVVNSNKAWCIPVKNHALTVNLGSITNVTGLAIQGEQLTKNYVTSYEVDYSQDGSTFVNVANGFKPKCSSKEFYGPYPGPSSNGSVIAENNVPVPFPAHYVRFRPQESVGKLCTTIDIRACISDDGYTPWSPWSSCILVLRTRCERRRERICNERFKGCHGSRNQTRQCNRNQCPRECGELGTTDENRSINDTAFTGSTFQPGFEPHKARLNGHLAWCALINDQHQYLEIDLGGEVEINQVKTQGLQRGNRSAWVTEFFLDTRRTDDSEWKDYRESGSVRIFKGNSSMMQSYILVEKPIGRFIRFYPLKWNGGICMRVSVSGCRVAPIVIPVAKKEDKVDETLWILLWSLLGLLLLLLLLGLLYLCCRYCPCCACFPCACLNKHKTRSQVDETMMTDLTSDQIDAARSQHAARVTQTDSGPRPLQAETQTVAMHLNDEDLGTRTTSFIGQGLQTGASSSGRYNEGYQFEEERMMSNQASRVNGMTSQHFSPVMTSSQDQKITSSKYEEERMRESKCDRGQIRSHRDTSQLVAGGHGGQYVGQYDVETYYPGERTGGQHRVLSPSVIDLEVSPQYENNSWRVDRLEKVDDRTAFGELRHDPGGSGLQYNGVRYRTEEDWKERRGSRFRGKELGSTGGYQGDGDVRTYTVHLGDEPEKLYRENEAKTAWGSYSQQDTYRARRGGRPAQVEMWKVDKIRGKAFEMNARPTKAREERRHHNHAPLSITSSDISSISDVTASSMSEHITNSKTKKRKFYKMFEYSQED